MLYRPAYAFYIVAAAIVAGTLLAKGDYVAGGILVAVAFGIYAGWRRVENRGEDDTFNVR